MNLWYTHFVRPLLFNFSPEWVHHQAMAAMKREAFTAPFSPWAEAPTPELEVELWGLKFRNPVGLAAGFDKDAQCLNAWQNLGFGYAEIGTVTPRPQPGNPSPRIFRIPEAKALINRMGFPNSGADAIAENLKELKRQQRWPSIPIGINIGKMKDTPLEEAHWDYLKCFDILHPYADFIEVNISSPNTPGLRQLQNKKFVEALFVPLLARRKELGLQTPILIKIAPDLSTAQITEMVEVCLDLGLDGIVATNTTLDHSSVALKETGGLSGLPLRDPSTEVIRLVVKESGGKIPVIGVGGVFTADDVQAKLDVGASLVQLYTGFIYQGPLVVRDICRGLMAKRDRR